MHRESHVVLPEVLAQRPRAVATQAPTATHDAPSRVITPTALRVASVTVKKTTASGFTPPDAAVLWRALDLCALAAEQQRRPHCPFGSDNDKGVPGVLAVICVEFPVRQRAYSSILGPLTGDYSDLLPSLQVLTILNNDYDDSAALGAFADIATRLRKLTVGRCGLTSLRGLEGRCEYLQGLDLRGCKQLSSLEGVGHHVLLEELDVTGTSIASVAVLQTCPALTFVDLYGCQQLSSLEGLGFHQWLEEVNISYTSIASLDSLRTCPALKRVSLEWCSPLRADGHVPVGVKVLLTS